MPVGSTSQRSVQESGFASIGLLTPPCRLYPLPVRQASALPTASSRFHLAMDTLAVQLTLPLAGCVEDFHLQVSAPCRAHQRGLSPPSECALPGAPNKKAVPVSNGTARGALKGEEDSNKILFRLRGFGSAGSSRGVVLRRRGRLCGVSHQPDIDSAVLLTSGGGAVGGSRLILP